MAQQAIEIQLNDGRKVYFRKPGKRERISFLQALPAMQVIAQAFPKAEQAGLLVPNQVALPDGSEAMLDKFTPLFASCTGLTPAEIDDLDPLEWFSLLGALMAFLPKAAMQIQSIS